jgi:PD-(D/E)XK endonuclease
MTFLPDLSTPPVRRCLFCEEVLLVPSRRGRGRPRRYCGCECRDAADAERLGGRKDTFTLNSKSRGNIALATAITYFVSHGYFVFLPVGDNGGPIDIIVSCDGVHIERVQCKYTRMRRRYTKTFRVQLITGSRNNTTIRYDEHSFDLLFVQTPVKIFLIPWGELWRLYKGKIPANLPLGDKMTSWEKSTIVNVA